MDRYYVRPKTADRIRALWLGPGIDRYATWMADRGAAKATAMQGIQALIHFGRFARDRGAVMWTDLPALMESFVDHWMREHGAWCTGARARQSLRSHPRTPVEQTLRLLIPGFVGTTTRRPVPFHETAPHFFEHLQQERGLRPATLYQYVYHLRVFEAYLRRLDVGAIGQISPALLTELPFDVATRLPGAVAPAVALCTSGRPREAGGVGDAAQAAREVSRRGAEDRRRPARD